MKLEHVAINVEKPLEMADWYVQYLNLNIVRQLNDPPYTTFMSDSSGRVMIEVYRNVAASVPDYKSIDPLIMHFAFVSENPVSDKEKLLDGGASYHSEIKLEDGTHLIMMRDPWGIPIQLCKRTFKMLDADPS